MSRRYAFGRFEIRPDERRVLETGEPVAVGARAFDLLLALIEHRDRVVGKDELLALVWPGMVVEQSNLTVHVSALRKLLGTEAISTVPGRGYRLTLVLEEPGDASPVTDTARFPSLSLPEKPSIAVMPFANLSGDPEQEYFADGMTADIITELSRFDSIFVIARNTTLTYKGKSDDTRRVARELGVHFVLEGSVRRSGQRVRVNAQLIDGHTLRTVWSERFEDVVDDVFDMQERITRQVVACLVSEVVAEELRMSERGSLRFTPAYDTAWRALKALTDGLTAGDRARCARAIAFANAAAESDARCSTAWYVLATALGWQAFYGWTDDRNAALAAAEQAANKLMELEPNSGWAYLARGFVARVSGSYERGLADLRRSIGLNPNNAQAMFLLAVAEAGAGNADEAKALAARALRLSPKDRWIGTAHLALAMSAFIECDFEALRRWAELAIQSQPTAPMRRVMMILYAVEKGDQALRHAHADKLNSFTPDFVPSLFRDDYRMFDRPEHMTRLLDSLRKAGMA